ncbi:hypothetical protein SAMN05444397_10178 [Flavobacterium aquidurense]|uniref:Uncharacterized protein n=1 Tax=Flavobacterium frigidimaris TaxID=262320 RepID=A0ABX4BM09_FLAFR|nr:hypothetical protein [Flavobacterium frigidimaris]OXA76599.1 hypothetical protein B0A65_18235 [Flavobacterium frigidimaris]SDY21983.1 hypothetical protein SAMN05444397_10178 [Flavobacterium aquidurense]
MFKSHELYLINNLLNKIKYSEFDTSELNEFANSPITNEILEKLKIYFEEKTAGTHLAKNIRKSCFELDNQIGIVIQNRIKNMDDNTFEVISKWDNSEVEQFALEIIGPMDFEKIELNKLTIFITEIAKEKTSR